MFSNLLTRRHKTNRPSLPCVTMYCTDIKITNHASDRLYRFNREQWETLLKLKTVAAQCHVALFTCTSYTIQYRSNVSYHLAGHVSFLSRRVSYLSRSFLVSCECTVSTLSTLCIQVNVKTPCFCTIKRDLTSFFSCVKKWDKILCVISEYIISTVTSTLAFNHFTVL